MTASNSIEVTQVEWAQETSSHMLLALRNCSSANYPAASLATTDKQGGADKKPAAKLQPTVPGSGPAADRADDLMIRLGDQCTIPAAL
jgi:hypothetical protein